MDHIPVEKSAWVKSYAYDPETETMEVTAQNGAVYTYAGVQQGHYDAFHAHPSKGNAVTTILKGNGYTGTKK